jgi:hypothetical protein
MKIVVLLLFVLNFSILCIAQKLPFQGKLIESGTSVNGTRSIEVGLPGLSWSETHTNVQITDGLYFIVLGSITPLPANLFIGVDERQLTLSVDGTALSPVTLYKPLSGDLVVEADATKEKITNIKLNGSILEITEGGQIHGVDLSELVRQAYNDGFDAGMIQGYDLGYSHGILDGYDLGYDDGYLDGFYRYPKKF